MNTTRLGTVLSALALVPAAILTLQPASASSATSDEMPYCHSDAQTPPYCTPLPTVKKKDYKGEPIAVQDKVKATGLKCDKYVNVLRNDFIEKKRKIKRIEITYRNAMGTDITPAVVGKKIRLRFVDPAWGGYFLKYRVVDFKNRKSDETALGIQVGFGYQGDKNMC
jgi:hypothetical protein